MKVKNAKIKNVTAGTYDNLLTCVSLEFHYQFYFKFFIFKMGNPGELENFKKLIEFADVTEFKDLEGKVIRVAEHEGAVKAIGHLIEDRFVDVTNTMISIVEELTEAELLKKYLET